MKLTGIHYFLLCIFIASPFFLKGQDNYADHTISMNIPEVALISIVSEDIGNTEIRLSAPGEAGDPVKLSELNSNQGIWINYSSVIANNNHRRKIMAAVQNEIPAGLHLWVEASAASGKGKGLLGKPAGRILLSGKPAEVVSDIGSCFTGKGLENGHRLTYTLENQSTVETYGFMARQEVTVNVIYTLTDYN